MASRYAIETVFNLIDKVSAPTSKVGKALDSLGIKSKAVSNAIKNDFDKAAERVDRLGKSIKKTIGFLAAAAFAAVGAGIALATKQFIEFENALHKAGAVFSDLDPTANDFKKKLKDLGIEARNVAAATEFNATQTANALATMAMAGIKSEQAVAILPRVADMATAAGIDLDKAVGIAADAMGVFNLMTDDPLKLANNLQYVSDVMVKTASLANMDLPLMYEAVKAGGKQFTTANQAIEDFGAAVDVLAANGYKGAEAGTALNTMMLRLAAPAKKGQDALNKLGIKTRDSRGNLLNFIDIIAQFEGKMKGMGSAEQAQFLDAIFGKQQYAKAAALITTGSDALRGYSNELRNAAGATEQMAGVMRGSLQNRIEVLKSSLMELGFKFVDAFAEKGGEAIGKITNVINNFDITPLIGIAQAVAGAIAGLASVIFGAVKIIWQFRYVILAIVAPIAAYHVALMAITVASRLYAEWQAIMKVVNFFAALSMQAQTTSAVGLSAALSGLTIKTIAQTIASKAQALWLGIVSGAKLAYAAAAGVATAAQWAFNAALTANPIGVIIMAVAALIALIVILAKNWNKITTAIKNNTEKVFAVLTILFGPIGFIISMIKEIASNWARIKEALAATGLFDKIKEIGSAIINFVKPAIDWLINVWNTVKNAVANFFSYVVNGIKSFFEPAISAVSGFFGKIFNAVYNFVKPALDWFGEKWLQIVSFFKDNAIVNAIKVIGGTLLSGILAPVQGLLEILSYIPGLGHLAGKGAEKIQEFRNFLKGVDGATVTAEVNPPDNVTLTPPTGTGTQNLTAPDFDMADFAIGGASTAGRSKLHGVVDISGGAVAQPFGGSGSAYTASGATESPSVNSAPAVLEIISRNVTSIASALNKISATVNSIDQKMPIQARGDIPEIIRPQTATQTAFELPRVNMSGGDEDAPDFHNPRNIAPVTQAERTAYSVEERINRLIIEVAAEKGTTARVVRAPRDAEIQLTRSGGNL